MRHIVICDLSGSTVFFPHYLIKGTIFERKKKKVTEYKLCVSSFSTKFVRNIFHSQKNWARYNRNFILVLTYSNLYSCTIVMKLAFSAWIFEKYWYIKLRKNPSIGSRVVPCGRTDGRTDMTKLIVAFRNFSKAPKTLECLKLIANYSILYQWAKFIIHFLYGPICLAGMEQRWWLSGKHRTVQRNPVQVTLCLPQDNNGGSA